MDLFPPLSRRRRRGKGRIVAKANFDVWTEAKASDIVIPVMGPTGAGKSTFINEAIEQQLLAVSKRMKSCTTQPCPVVIDPIPGYPNLQGRRLVLVDTPGFDDTGQDDVDILTRIAKWLEESYKKKMFLGGVLYLHDISIMRFTGTARKNLEMFSRLCGKATLNKVILVLTNWSGTRVHEERENELKSEYWKHLISQRAEVRKFLKDWNSAWDILDVFLSRINTPQTHVHDVLRIQIELVDRHMIIPETEAGRALRSTLKEIIETQKEAAQFEATLAGGEDPEAKEKLNQALAKIEKLEEQIQALHIPLPQRIRRWLRLL